MLRLVLALLLCSISLRQLDLGREGRVLRSIDARTTLVRYRYPYPSGQKAKKKTFTNHESPPGVGSCHTFPWTTIFKVTSYMKNTYITATQIQTDEGQANQPG